MLRTLLVLAAPLLLAAPPEDARCGLDQDVVPGFSLQDFNPNSPTYGEWVSRTDGEVLLVYWAVAT